MENTIKELYFVTGNAHKFEEVKKWLLELDPYIELKQADIDLPEIQSLDVEEVALLKAKEAWRLIQKPLLIDDGGLYIDQYNKFPGTLSKYVFQGIGLEGLWLLAKDDPRGHFMSCLVYAAGINDCHVFKGICSGTLQDIADKPYTNTMPFTYIFTPAGSDKTFAQMRGTHEEKQYHHRYKALSALVAWLRK